MSKEPKKTVFDKETYLATVERLETWARLVRKLEESEEESRRLRKEISDLEKDSTVGNFKGLARKASMRSTFSGNTSGEEENAADSEEEITEEKTRDDEPDVLGPSSKKRKLVTVKVANPKDGTKTSVDTTTTKKPVKSKEKPPTSKK